MQVPLELQFKDPAASPDLEVRLRSKVAHLERLCHDIISCRVLVEQPHTHASSGNPFRVRIEITVPPGNEIVVTRDPRNHELSESLVAVVNSAFAAAERQLREVVDRRRRDVKTHDLGYDEVAS